MPSSPLQSDLPLSVAEAADRYARTRAAREASWYARRRAGLVPKFRQAAKERTCELIRGVLIERLDDALGRVRHPLCDRFGLTPDHWLELVQAVQVALFPEEFAEDGEAARRAAEVRAGKLSGVVPAAGTGLLNRAERGDLARFAERLAAS